MADHKQGGFGRALVLGGLQTAILLGLSLASIKLTAKYLGPAGLAETSQVQGLVDVCSGVIGATLGTAVVRMSSEYGMQDQRLPRLVGTAARLAVYVGIFILIVLALFSSPIADWLVGNRDRYFIVAAAGFGALAINMCAVMSGAINGAHESGVVATVRIIGGICTFALYAAGMLTWGLQGAMLAMACGGIAQFIITLFVMHRKSSVDVKFLTGPWDTTEFHKIAAFFPMLLIHAVAEPLGLMILRREVLALLSADLAGQFQATYRLSQVALTLITTGVSLYFMPKLGALTGKPDLLRKEIWKVLVATASAAMVIAVVVSLLADVIVPLIFSDQFKEVAKLLPMQMAAIVIKMVSWILGFVLVSQLRRRWYILIEAIGPAIIVVGGIIGVRNIGVEGIVIAFIFSAAVQLIIGAFALRDILWPRS